MEKKTRLETLVSQYNSQLEIVVSREAQIRVLRNLEPHRVMEIRLDTNTMEPKKIRAEDMMKTATEKLELDQMWLKELETMIEEEKSDVDLRTFSVRSRGREEAGGEDPGEGVKE